MSHRPSGVFIAHGGGRSIGAPGSISVSKSLARCFFLGLERDRTGKVSRESLIDFVGQRIAQADKALDPQARETILARAGEDLRELRQEIEKLLLFRRRATDDSESRT